MYRKHGCSNHCRQNNVAISPQIQEYSKRVVHFNLYLHWNISFRNLTILLLRQFRKPSNTKISFAELVVDSRTSCDRCIQILEIKNYIYFISYYYCTTQDRSYPLANYLQARILSLFCGLVLFIVDFYCRPISILSQFFLLPYEIKTNLYFSL